MFFQMFLEEIIYLFVHLLLPIRYIGHSLYLIELACNLPVSISHFYLEIQTLFFYPIKCLYPSLSIYFFRIPV